MTTPAIILSVAVALAVGYGVGRTARSHGWAKALIGRIAVPAAALLAGAGLIAVLAWAAAESDWSDQLWGQIIAAIGLVTVTFGLYGTGGEVWTVTRAFSTGSGAEARTYAANTALSDSEYESLKTTHAANLKHQRGLYFRALFTGEDGRWSTSKMQMLLWTYAVLYGLLSIFVATQLGLDLELDLPGDETGTDFGDIQFDEQYLILLGGYFAAAVLAKGIKTNKVKEGEVGETTAEKVPNPVEGIKNLVTDDAGKADVGDAQFFLFNLLALTVFFVTFVPALEDGLPELPTFLVGLTSLSALAYVGKKATESATPKIVAVVPSKLRHGETLRIEGSYLAASTNLKPGITVDGAAVPASDVQVVTATGSFGAETALTAKVPAEAGAGAAKTVSVRPPGATAPATATIEIVQAKISDQGISKEPVPWRPGEVIAIAGTGFGPDPGPTSRKVTLGDAEINVSEWLDTRIVGTLPATLTSAPPADQLTLHIAVGEDTLVERPTKVELTAMTITKVDTEPIVLSEGTPVTITGTGFGQPPGGTAKLGDQALGIGSWSDTIIVASLGDGFPLSTAPPTDLTLEIERTGYASASRSVKVTIPSITVSDVVPKEVVAQPGTPVTIHGSGFGTEGALSTRIGEISLKLTDGARTDTVLQATVETVPDAVKQTLTGAAQAAQLVVEREGWAAGSIPVSLVMPVG